MRYTKSEIAKWIDMARETVFSFSKIGYVLIAIAEMMYNTTIEKLDTETLTQKQYEARNQTPYDTNLIGRMLKEFESE